MKLYDHALSLKGYENAAEAEAFELEIEIGGGEPIIAKAEDSRTIDGQTRQETLQNASKGGKARQKKLRKDNSLQLAEERRELRRVALGVTIHHDYRAWSKLRATDKEEFVLRKQSLGLMTRPATGLRWDFYRDFREDYSGEMDGTEHLDHLFRSGRVKPVERRKPFIAGIGTAGSEGETAL